MVLLFIYYFFFPLLIFIFLIKSPASNLPRPDLFARPESGLSPNEALLMRRR